MAFRKKKFAGKFAPPTHAIEGIVTIRNFDSCELRLPKLKVSRRLPHGRIHVNR